jgi:hypothetical protein
VPPAGPAALPGLVQQGPHAVEQRHGLADAGAALDQQRSRRGPVDDPLLVPVQPQQEALEGQLAGGARQRR